MPTHFPDLPGSSALTGDRSTRGLLVAIVVVAFATDLVSLLAVLLGWRHAWVPAVVGLPIVGLVMLAYAGAVGEATDARTFSFDSSRVRSVLRPAGEARAGMWLQGSGGDYVRIIDVRRERLVHLITAADTTLAEPDEHLALADFRLLGGRVHPDTDPQAQRADGWRPCVPATLDHCEFATPE